MEDSKICTLLSALKLDEQPLTNQFVFIEELNSADGSFILAALIKYQIKRSKHIILALCHNSFGHFQSIGLKLGFNLSSLIESGQIYLVDILEKIRKEDFLGLAHPLKYLYGEIKLLVDSWKGENGVCVIVENIGNFLLIEEEGSNEFFTFINYLRVIAAEEKDSSVGLSLHNFPDSSSFNRMVKSIRHSADMTAVVSDLQMGIADDVTGNLTVIRKEKNFRKSTSDYQYHLQDKSVSVFSPGAGSFF